ncbi:hypothetical protein WMY93_031914 [Mugilogobius chulae]|uniref:Beta/gamma crystallin 'Greek key' domain-containing protein n=1 Tax=Mugilogobius chulae TaxID=88201 RepID=A0AAW0MF23_9GOBI
MERNAKIIFFEDKNFQGRYFECSVDCPELSSHFSRCNSIRVEAGSWVAYERAHYTGYQYVLTRGEYPNYHSWNGFSETIRSCRALRHISEAKQVRAFIVLGWDTLEHQVTQWDIEWIVVVYLGKTLNPHCLSVCVHWVSGSLIALSALKVSSRHRLRIYERPDFGGQMMEVNEDLANLQDRWSRLDYCNGLLTGLSKQAVKQLQYIQNAAARVLTRTRKYDHISPVLRSLHWLPVAQRIDFKTALLVFKSLHGLAPKYISDMLVPYEPSRTLRTLGIGLLLVPRVRTKRGESAFQFYAAKIWNSLPEDDFGRSFIEKNREWSFVRGDVGWWKTRPDYHVYAPRASRESENLSNMDGFYDQQVPFGVPERRCPAEEEGRLNSRKRKFMETELAQDTEDLFQDLFQLQEIWIAEAQSPDDEQFVPDFQPNNVSVNGPAVQRVKRESSPSSQSPCRTPHRDMCLYPYSASCDSKPAGLKAPPPLQRQPHPLAAAPVRHCPQTLPLLPSSPQPPTERTEPAFCTSTQTGAPEWRLQRTAAVPEAVIRSQSPVPPSWFLRFLSAAVSEAPLGAAGPTWSSGVQTGAGGPCTLPLPPDLTLLRITLHNNNNNSSINNNSNSSNKQQQGTFHSSTLNKSPGTTLLTLTSKAVNPRSINLHICIGATTTASTEILRCSTTTRVLFQTDSTVR